MVLENLPINASDIVNLIQPFIMKLSLIVGGIFGLYFILILVKIYFERKKTKILKDIKYDLEQLNKHFKVPYAEEKTPLWKKVHKRITKSK